MLIAHHGGGGIGSLAEPKATFGPLADRFRVVVFDARGCGAVRGHPALLARAVGRRRRRRCGSGPAPRRSSWPAAPTAASSPWSTPSGTPSASSAIMLRDTSADGSNLELAFENARNQDRVEIDWERFNRYWHGETRDDADLKQLWTRADPALRLGVRPGAVGRRGGGRHLPARGAQLVLPAQLGRLRPQGRPARGDRPTLVTVGRYDWVTPVSSSETIASLLPNAELVVFEHSGHSPQNEERELFQATMRGFLDRAVPAPVTRVSGPLVIIGAGAIGGTLGAHLARAGHDVLLCDVDAAHVAAIREHGLRIEGPVERVHRRRSPRSPPTSCPTDRAGRSWR